MGAGTVLKLAGLAALTAAIIYAAVGSHGQAVAGLTGQQLAALVAAALAGLHIPPAVNKIKQPTAKEKRP